MGVTMTSLIVRSQLRLPRDAAGVWAGVWASTGASNPPAVIAPAVRPVRLRQSRRDMRMARLQERRAQWGRSTPAYGKTVASEMRTELQPECCLRRRQALR